MSTIALGIPHLPDDGGPRDRSLQRLLECLDLEPNDVTPGLGHPCTAARLFTDAEPNREWALRMWRWGADTDADWFLTLQDDTMVSDDFWSQLLAMLSAADTVGARVVGLAAVHPAARELARQSHRWYRTRAWLIGWGYAIRRDELARFLDWIRPINDGVTEDSLLNAYLHERAVDAWHPIPTIVDHDTTLHSHYPGNDFHAHRRASVTWHEYGRELGRPEFWRPSCRPDTVPMLACPAPRHCWACLDKPALVGLANGVNLCWGCLSGAWSTVVGQLVAR